MAKLTVRIDDVLAEELRDFCTINGLTIQSVIESMIVNVTQQHRVERGRPVSRYTNASQEVRARFVTMVDRARGMDARRRKRK